MDKITGHECLLKVKKVNPHTALKSILTEIFVMHCQIDITKQNKEYIDTFVTQVICMIEGPSTPRLDQSEQS